MLKSPTGLFQFRLDFKTLPTSSRPKGSGSSPPRRSTACRVCRELTTLQKQVGGDEGLELKVTVVEAKVGQEQVEEGKGKGQGRQLNGCQVGVDKRTV